MAKLLLILNRPLDYQQMLPALMLQQLSLASITSTMISDHLTRIFYPLPMVVTDQLLKK
jgi:hypothetical protein